MTAGPRRILAGDVGGTKTVVALFEVPEAEGAQGPLRCVERARFESGAHGGLEEILELFRGRVPGADWDAARVEGACFGVAGPVIEQSVTATNLPWPAVAAESLSAALGGRPVRLLNDLCAMAIGMRSMAADELAVVNRGEPRRGNIAVIAPGTGLGEAMLALAGGRYWPVASEGGHADFAPRTDAEIGLLRHLQRATGELRHVSWERVLSGSGLQSIYSYLRGRASVEEPAWLRDELARGDRNAAITRLGVQDRHPLCTAAVEMFAQLLGAEAGNLALKCLAVGGVFLGGSLARAIVPARRADFLRSFVDKGRFSELLSAVPVSVARHGDAPLRGAALYFLQCP